MGRYREVLLFDRIISAAFRALPDDTLDTIQLLWLCLLEGLKGLQIAPIA